MSTTLGKRSRASVDAADTISRRSKRRIVINEPNDENQNPFVSHQDRVGAEDGMEVEDVKMPAKRTRTSARTVPAKHGAPESRVKIDAHFKVSKSAIEVYQDGKSEVKGSPRTPRHRDALSKVPITPRHRVLLAGSQTPRTPKTPVIPSSTSIYNQARQLFARCSNPGKLVGRDNERKELSAFLEESISSRSGGCLYVSGPPGTGKSALVDETFQQWRDASAVKSAVVNCMSIRNAKELTQKLCEGLELGAGGGFDYLRTCFIRGKAKDSQNYLVILDDVDRLVDMDLDLLYSLFEWSMQPASRLVLVGIANALDLTDRFLPRLKSRDLKPELLPFMPYTASQIAEVLTARLRTLTPGDAPIVPFLHPAAVQFCAKKVASQTGDLRKAFDICRRAIDLAEQETREKDAKAALQDSPSKTPLMDNINLSSPPTPRSPAEAFAKGHVSPTAYTVESAPKATIAHMAKVTAQVFGNGTTQRLGSLNLQQKAVLCSLAALEKRKRDTQVERNMFATPSKHNNAAPSIKQLFEAYCNLCKQDQLLHPLTSVEFRDVVSGLETLSLVSGMDGKNGSFAMPITPSRTPSRKGKGGFGMVAVGDERRVASAVGLKELEGALEGVGGELLREILHGSALL